MATQSVEAIVDMLITDREFRAQFEENRAATVKSLGLPTCVEKALLDLDVHALVDAATVKGHLLNLADV